MKFLAGLQLVAFCVALGVPWVKPESDGSSQGTFWPPDVTQGPSEQRLLLRAPAPCSWIDQAMMSSGCVLPATLVVVFSHISQQSLHRTCEKNVYVKPNAAPHPPSNPLKIPLYQTCKCLALTRLLWSPINFTNWPKHFLVEKSCIPEVLSLIKLLPYYRSGLLFL